MVFTQLCLKSWVFFLQEDMRHHIGQSRLQPATHGQARRGSPGIFTTETVGKR